VDTFCGHLQLAALGDLDCLHRLVARGGLDLLDLLDDVVSIKDLAEDDVAAIEPAVCDLVSERDLCEVFMEASSYEVMTVVMKNCEPFVSFPALAMERRPFLVCFSLKFSSANFSP
jgi:hypothetical protein